MQSQKQSKCGTDRKGRVALVHAGVHLLDDEPLEHNGGECEGETICQEANNEGRQEPKNAGLGACAQEGLVTRARSAHQRLPNKQSQFRTCELKFLGEFVAWGSQHNMVSMYWESSNWPCTRVTAESPFKGLTETSIKKAN